MTRSTSEEATRRFYAHVWPLRAVVLRTARFLCGNGAEADDLAQEVLLKAFKAMGTVDTADRMQGWLMTILRHTHIDRLRSSARWAGHVHVDEMKTELADGRPVSVPLVDVQDAGALLEQFSDERLLEELRRLPDEIRWTLLLVDVEQMSYEDAAKIVEVPAGTVKSRVHRGRGMLRERLLHKGATVDAAGQRAEGRVA